MDTDDLPLASLKRIEQACAQFEREHHAEIDLAACLEGHSGRERAALLFELVALDVELRTKKGWPVHRERYGRFDAPEDQASGQEAWRRIRDEATNSIPASTIRGGATSRPPAAPEATFGPYRVLRKIGAGGMGNVYLAEQREPVKRRVALKIIRTTSPSQEILTRFAAERQALALMDHHHIARVLDAGMTPAGQPYFAMEYVEGETITEYCARHGTSLRPRLELFVQTCRAVQHAHQKGVVHRDLKPANILVTRQDGRPQIKVIDFGLAKALDADLRLTDHTLLTQHGQVFGTLAYMSPEQAAANALDVDARTDVYSLGVVLFELLTGSTPLRSELIREQPLDVVLQLIREADAPRPSVRVSETASPISPALLRNDLDWVVARALEKDRSRRYDTPSALADDVQRFLDDETVAARRPSMRYVLSKAVRKHRRTFAATATVLFLLVAAVIVSGGMWWRAAIAEADSRQAGDKARREALDAIRARAEMRNERDRALEARRRAVQAGARTNYFLAVARWDAGRADEANALLDQIPVEHRGLEWRLAKSRFRGSDVACYGHLGRALDVACNRRGDLLASVGSDAVRIWDAVTGEQRHLLPGGYSSACFGADSTQLFTGSIQGDILLWDVPKQRIIQRFPGQEFPAASLALSANGRRLASSGRGGRVRIWDVAAADLLQSIPCLDSATGRCPLALSPDGRLVATALPSHQLVLCHADTGQEVWRSKSNRLFEARLVFPPSGQGLLAAGVRSSEGVIQLRSLESGEILWEHTSLSHQFTSIAASPDGSRVAAGTRLGDIVILQADSGRELGRLQGHSSRVHQVEFYPDGARLASSSDDTTVRIWDVAQADRAARIDARSYETVQFSPDGSRILCSGLGWSLWDARTGLLLHQNRGQMQTATSARFSQAGDRIIASRYEFNAASLPVASSVEVWDAERDARIMAWDTGPNRTWSACSSPDDRLVAAACSDAVRIWSVESGQVVSQWAWNVNLAWQARSGLDWSPDGERLAATSLRTIQVREVATGQLLWEAHCPGSQVCRYHPDGHAILTADQSPRPVLRLWNADTGRLIRTLTGHRGSSVEDACFSTDGSRIVSTGDDQTVRVWDAATGEELLCLSVPGEDSGAYSVALSPSGRQMAVASRPGTFVFQTPSTAESQILNGHHGAVHSVSFNPQGTRIYSRSGEERIVWDARSGERLQEADWREITPPVFASPDGRRFVLAVGPRLTLVHRESQQDPWETGYRLWKGRPPRAWFSIQAAAANQAENWFAQTFFMAWQLRTSQQTSDRERLLLQESFRRVAPSERHALQWLVDDVLANSDG